MKGFLGTVDYSGFYLIAGLIFAWIGFLVWAGLIRARGRGRSAWIVLFGLMLFPLFVVAFTFLESAGDRMGSGLSALLPFFVGLPTLFFVTGWFAFWWYGTMIDDSKDLENLQAVQNRVASQKRIQATKIKPTKKDQERP